MKLGIMQPYYLPYLGYWQLINAVDTYVIYDDVNYIKGGWINRNRILINGKASYINLPLLGASPNKLINEISLDCSDRFINKSLRMIDNAYRRAPFYSEIQLLFESIVRCPETNLAAFLEASISLVCGYLDIDTTLVTSSSLSKDTNLKGQDKVLAICNELGATEYYNAIGGKNLYSFDEFDANGVALRFLQADDIVYPQFGEAFQPNLSILDVLMFNGRIGAAEFLNDYRIISS